MQFYLGWKKFNVMFDLLYKEQKYNMSNKMDPEIHGTLQPVYFFVAVFQGGFFLPLIALLGLFYMRHRSYASFVVQFCKGE